jgi:AraC-like DNA-binding protein
MYVEQRVSGELRQLALCSWQQTPSRAASVRIVPDGCIDIVWNGRALVVAGPDTRAWHQPVQAGTHIIGLRFGPGQGGRVLGAPASALRNARVELGDLWGERGRMLADRVADERDPSRALDRIVDAVQQPGAARAADPLVRHVVAQVQLAGRAAPSVRTLAAEVGVTERQLLRRCTDALGYGPKLLARILRFQRFLEALAAQPELSLAELAHALGYADQSHLAHDTAELAGTAPSQLRAERAPRPMSDFDKTRQADARQAPPHEDHRLGTTGAR